MEDLKGRFGRINNRLDEVEKQNELLREVNDEVNMKIISRIKGVAYESHEIKAER